MLASLDSFLSTCGKVLLTTHENPDGDGIGAMTGLALHLEALGREVRVVVSPEVPAFLSFIDAGARIEAYDPGGAHRDLAAWPDTWMLVDASEPTRLGPLHEAFQATGAVKVCLDHHLKEAPRGFDREFVDPSASASAELVLDLVERSGELTAPMARALYAGIVDDTGNFRFSNATPKVHRAAARLIEAGADPARTYQALYHQGRLQKIRLASRAFDGMRLLAGGQVAILTLSEADLAACGAHHDDMEGLVNRPLELKGVEASCLLYERADGRIKASLRSRERVNVNAVCRLFGGGGHRLASGATLDPPLASARERLEAALLAQAALDAPQ